jgi:hypothetical protein
VKSKGSGHVAKHTKQTGPVARKEVNGKQGMHQS